MKVVVVDVQKVLCTKSICLQLTYNDGFHIHLVMIWAYGCTLVVTLNRLFAKN